MVAEYTTIPAREYFPSFTPRCGWTSGVVVQAFVVPNDVIAPWHAAEEDAETGKAAHDRKEGQLSYGSRSSVWAKIMYTACSASDPRQESPASDFRPASGGSALHPVNFRQRGPVARRFHDM